MIQCPDCRTSYVTNTIFCPECGLYLLESKEMGTGLLEPDTSEWSPDAPNRSDSSSTGLSTIRLRIRTLKPSRVPSSPSAGSPFCLSRSLAVRGAGSGLGNRHKGQRAGTRELEVSLTKPVRLGRIDPKEGVYPDIDLTSELAMECGVSREHACIFRRGGAIEVEDLASTNGTMLNGTRLSPYLPVPLKDGDQLQLGKLLIEVSFGRHHRRDVTTETRIATSH